MKNIVLKTFASIGVVTSVIFACSSAMDDSSSSMNGSWDLVYASNGVAIYNTETGESKRIDEIPYREWTVGLTSSSPRTPSGPYKMVYAKGYVYIVDTVAGEVFRQGGANVFSPEWSDSFYQD